MSVRSDVIICPGLTSARGLECQVHFSACQEPPLMPGVCTCVGFRELCILAAAAATFHSDILHPFNICVFMWTSWLRSLRLLALWHCLIRFSTAASCSSMLIQVRLKWALKLAFLTRWCCSTQNWDAMNPQAVHEDLPPNNSELRLHLTTCLIFHLQSWANPLCDGIVTLLTSPPCEKGRLFPVPHELNEGFSLSCCYWYAITTRIMPAFLWKCQPASAKWVHLDDPGGYTTNNNANSCLGANFNWNLPWKQESASHLANWGLIIFTL